MRFLLSIEVNSHPLQPVEGSGGVYSNAISIGSGFFPLGSDGLGFASGLVFQPNGERGPLMNLRPSFFQKHPGPGWVAGHQGILFLVQYENMHPFSLSLRCSGLAVVTRPLRGVSPLECCIAASARALGPTVSPLPSRLSALVLSSVRD